MMLFWIITSLTASSWTVGPNAGTKSRSRSRNFPFPSFPLPFPAYTHIIWSSARELFQSRGLAALMPAQKDARVRDSLPPSLSPSLHHTHFPVYKFFFEIIISYVLPSTTSSDDLRKRPSSCCTRIYKTKRPNMAAANFAALTSNCLHLDWQWLKMQKTKYFKITNPLDYEIENDLSSTMLKWHDSLGARRIESLVIGSHCCNLWVFYPEPQSCVHVHGATFRTEKTKK